MFLFDAHAVLFTVRIWGASSYETCRANDISSILVLFLALEESSGFARNLRFLDF